MEPIIISIPEFHVIGLSLTANLKEIEEKQLGKEMYESLFSRANEMK